MQYRHPEDSEKHIVKTYTLTLDGHALHYYGQGVYGWGPISTTTGKLGRLVEWLLRSEADYWAKQRAVFCTGAVIELLAV